MISLGVAHNRKRDKKEALDVLTPFVKPVTLLHARIKDYSKSQDAYTGSFYIL